MSVLSDFFMIVVAAILFQNAIITRALGSSKEILNLSSNEDILRFGGFLTSYIFFSALASWPFYRMIRRFPVETVLGSRFFYSVTTLLCSFIVFLILFYTTRTFLPRIHYYLRKMRVMLLFNCAVLGTILIVFNHGDTLLQTLKLPAYAANTGYATLWQTMAFALGSGAGYTAALLLVNEARRRLALSDVPKAFRGLPVTLLYVGIFSLAIHGLIGNHAILN